MQLGEAISFEGSIGRQSHRTDFGPSVDDVLSGSRRVADFLDILTDETVRQVAEFWIEEVKAIGSLPERKAFAPSRILPWIQNIAFMRREVNDDWRIAYCGTRIVEYFGADVTGELITAIADPTTHAIWDRNTTRMIEEQRIFVEQYGMTFTDRPYLRIWDLAFPLQSEDGSGLTQFAAFLLAKPT